jgi:hypothetical protein
MRIADLIAHWLLQMGAGRSTVQHSTAQHIQHVVCLARLPTGYLWLLLQLEHSRLDPSTATLEDKRRYHLLATSKGPQPSKKDA